MAISFIDCTSLNINYNVMGIVTISYTVIQDTYDFNNVETIISAGGQVFSGYVTDASITPIPRTNWFEIHVALTATTD